MRHDIIDPRAPHIALVMRGCAWTAECTPCHTAQQLAPVEGKLDGEALRRYEAFAAKHRHAAGKGVGA